MVELGWEIDGDDLGIQPCDGMICATPSGSTAYNLSNGGPVLMWGIDAMAITFVAPHSLRGRPLVVPRGRMLRITKRTEDVDVAVLTDGHRIGKLGPRASLDVGLGERRSRLAVLPEVTFFRRLNAIFP
jgi:NAD+ kinase